MNIEREMWLNKAMNLIIDQVFSPNELRIPPRLTIAAGLCPGKALGICSKPQYSDEAAVHIWITPELGTDDAMTVLGIICHELCHAVCHADGYDVVGHSHSHPFPQHCKTVGLSGKPKSAIAQEGTELWSTLEGINMTLGVYPHKPLRKKEAKTRKSEILALVSSTDPDFQVKVKFSQVYEKGMPKDFNGEPMVAKDPAKFSELEEAYLSQPDEEQEAADAEEKAAE
jgi:hypothetical protein